ncbi:hypothetical protein A9Q84_17880 [Halobacteriovorax marinus]|uniref:DUF2834 domain-containing protein n=1 Tax=Halobacteriovorax marinus TaxID=97084 RepID=A0A1Y5F3M7_9BACT|nr:hypothetical protein A9Q84_17880 [Halobacteriovorax marinus]
MENSAKIRCWIYLLLGISATVVCMNQNVHYISGSFIQTNIDFWKDTWVNPASRSITLDIFFLTASIAVWMIHEAMRLKIKHVWAYLVFGLIIAISLTVPLFLIAREFAIAKNNTKSSSTPQPAG